MINNKNIKKFSADKEYWWIFRSNEIFEIENENGYTVTVRWEYENNSKFSMLFFLQIIPLVEF